MFEDRRYEDRAVTLKPLLGRMLKVSKKTTKKQSSIQDRWAQVMPDSVKKYAKLESFKDNKLTVLLNSSAILAELSAAKQNTIDMLNEDKSVFVDDIIYRLG